ncbi:uncharacterized protein LOC131701758 [Acipenser ruthenus]|uniref:uncharacterized protein LOC131701758 n=1 Tax=Acipenser ruthenus TaxID=7906 RepID=UPI002741AFAE|nr:uncharacterized protein LOC117974108 isoform X1 [Acipenser ruthenus]XP_058857555.1 uncharacterized protein LOC131701758 [Acipenser ruthenus]
MYAVVLFKETEEVEVVPSVWLNVDKLLCLWPSYKSTVRVRKAVELQETPTETWDKHEVRVLHETVTYEKARKKLRRATETSDLNTTDDEQTRKRKPSTKLSFLEDEEDFSISKNVRSSQRMPLLPTPPLFPTTVASPSSSSSSSSSKNTSNSEDGNISSDDRNYNSNTSSNDTGTGNRDKSSYVPLSDRDRMIFTILEEIKGQGRQNTLMLQALLKRQPHVEQEHGSLRLDEFRFPLDTKEDIDRVERMLMDQATEKALITHICSLGGTTADDIIRRMMSHVLTNNLARGYNWLGRGNKSPFSVLALARVIKAAAKKSSVTEADTEARMRSWLKYSGDRDGGRKRRAEKKKDAEPANAATIAAASAASDIEED